MPRSRSPRVMIVLSLALGAASCVSARASSTQSDSATSAVPAAQRAFELVRPHFDGKRALAVVAFMDNYWRTPGNTGFNASVAHVEAILRDAGYVEEKSAPPGARLTYRVETRPVAHSWEPESASVAIAGIATPLLRFATNRNMLAINSYSTPAAGIEADVVLLPVVADSAFARVDVRGKIVHADAPVSRLFADAVVKRGALGVLAYNMPAYTQPAVHRRSIQFSSIPNDTVRRAWGILL